MRLRLFVAALAAALSTGAFAQEALKRIELQKQLYPPDKYSTSIYMVVVPVGGVVARHSHPGVEMGYVIDGESTFQVEGQPEVTLKPESTYSVPPGAIHTAKNIGQKPVRIIATFVVEKDKPMAAPAP